MNNAKDKAIRKLDALKRAIEKEQRNQTGIHITNTDRLFVECHAAIAALQEPERSGQYVPCLHGMYWLVRRGRSLFTR